MGPETNGNLYALLGVKADAKPDEIRRAYRLLAVKLHPDRNPGDAAAEARFKTISDAYGVLADPDRRAKYDQDRAGAKAAPAPNYPVAGTPVEVVIDPIEHAKGCTKTVTVSRRRRCPDCGGMGTVSETYWSVCRFCAGGGCQHCGWTGRNSACGRCWGSGSDNELTTIRVTVTPGLAPAMRHRLVGHGDLWGLKGPFYIDAKVLVRAHRPGLIVR